ncbi:MAG TPA: Gfo/Idh/MocA family oxidoreductase [Opitutaceae bacterium]|nr:Gfo/Idh/MocA family oxidoreductase [Opitutaceae bacterium]
MLTPPLRQKPDLPTNPRPIVSIGAGGIVRDAHMPAYRRAGWKVASVFDTDLAKAEALARDFAIPRACASLAEAVASASEGAVFDLATPATAIAEILPLLPNDAAVLMQKPLGLDLGMASAIRDICRAKRLKAAVNLQLRFAPNMMAARDIISRGLIGDLHDVDVRVTCSMPWHIWKFLYGIPRMEIIYHSIHYVDLVRSFLGDPAGVWCKTVKHPEMMELASTRTAIALDYGDVTRANIATNHGHKYGGRHQESTLKVEGTKGAIVVRMGVNLDYPRGRPDELEYCVLGEGAPAWTTVLLEGQWFPHAFVGPMASLMRFASGESDTLPTSVEDAWRTMAVIEACHASSDRGAVKISP